MKILHTSDWHLGKTLNQYSRLNEQAAFIAELNQICDEHSVDAILVAGDIYDTYNPQTAAEELFFSAASLLTSNGRRPLIVIAGNHDSPEKITASAPLATPAGVILCGTPKTVVGTGEFEHFSIVDSGEGFFEMRIGHESIVVLTFPYMNEKRMNEVISIAATEEELREGLQDKIRKMFGEKSSKFREDTVNIVVGHFFIVGGEASSERPSQFGGVHAVEASVLPRCDYIAMGHLHRAQKIPCAATHAYYSGSPLQYSLTEADNPKCVYIADITAGGEAKVEKIYLKNIKRLELVRFKSIEEAISFCENESGEDGYIYMEVHSDRHFYPEELQTIRKSCLSIVDVSVILPEEGRAVEPDTGDNRTILSEFEEYYASARGVYAKDELIEMMKEVLGEGGEDEKENGEGAV